MDIKKGWNTWPVNAGLGVDVEDNAANVEGGACLTRGLSHREVLLTLFLLSSTAQRSGFDMKTGGAIIFQYHQETFKEFIFEH